MLQRLCGAGVKRTLLLALSSVAPFATCGATTPDLIYYGGPVVSHAVIVPVNWNSDVDATLQQNLPQFYADVAQSSYWDLLALYSTVDVTPQDALPGSGQMIARGSATAGITITPVQCAAGVGSLAAPCTVTEADIDTELNRQLGLAQLPPPALDASGYVDTVYMLNFPPAVRVILGTAPPLSTSCVDFCNANTTLLRNGLNMAIGVVMDYGTSACAAGCGSGSTALERATENASYALVDSVTDPLFGAAPSIARPLAWYDAASGQVGDYCFNQNVTNAGTITSDVRTWSVGKFWSPQTSTCMAAHYMYFSITPSPTSVTVNQGATVPVTIQTGSFGIVQSITLAVNSLPTGVGAAFDAPIISDGMSTTLQLSADHSATPGTVTVDIGARMALPYADYEVSTITLTIRADNIFHSSFD